jgi:hypothetical protein
MTMTDQRDVFDDVTPECGSCGRALVDRHGYPFTRLGVLCWRCYDQVRAMAGPEHSMLEFTLADVVEDDD